MVVSPAPSQTVLRVQGVSKGFPWPSLYEDADTLLKQLGIRLNARARVGWLSVAQQQMVDIAHALSWKRRTGGRMRRGQKLGLSALLGL